MPTPYLKKLAKEGKGSISSLEKKWDTAKSKAKEQGKGSNYGYITSIFKSMVGASATASFVLADEEVTARTAYIDSLVEHGKGTREELEKKWDEAIAIANKEGINAYAYAVGVFNKLIGASVEEAKYETWEGISIGGYV
jgi:hypothetical protein